MNSTRWMMNYAALEEGRDLLAELAGTEEHATAPEDRAPWIAIEWTEVEAVPTAGRYPILIEVTASGPPMYGAGLRRLAADERVAVLAMTREQARELIAQLEAALR